MRKSVVITGASKGIGRAVADPLAEQGWSVIGVARSSPPDIFPEFLLRQTLQTRIRPMLSPRTWPLAETCLES